MSSGATSGDPTTGPHTGWDPGDLTGVEASSQTLTRTVDALTAEDLGAPSLLPGWTRAHVVAHLALNAFALAQVIDGVIQGNPVAMYESDEQREADIAELAQSDGAELRERHLEGVTAFSDAVGRLRDEHWSDRIDRLPGGPAWPMVTVVPTRRREVELHHADLGTAYSPADFPEDFVAELLDTVTVDQADSGPFRVRAVDLGREWSVGGAGGSTVMGTGGDLGWWLAGRGSGDGLSCDAEELPRLAAWRRAAGRTVS